MRAFYGRALTDPVIGFIFVDVAHLDLEEHVPVIASFWETILLGAQTYSGGAFAVHASLNRQVRLRGGRRALARAVDDDGRRPVRGRAAELAKSHAQRVARAFHSRLRGLDHPPLSIDPAATLTITHHDAKESP